MAGVPSHNADEVEQRVRRVLNGVGGEVFVPRVAYKGWYTENEAKDVFRLAAKKVIAHAQHGEEQPTPSAVFLLYLRATTPALLNSLLTWFGFWAWPEELRHEGVALPPSEPSHWVKTPVLASEAVVRAVRRVQALESPSKRMSVALRELKNPYLLPPVNFHFPDKNSHLRDIYWRVLREERGVELPRLQRVGAGNHRIVGNQHYRDACGRFFPLGKGEHGALRDLDAEQRQDDWTRFVWLNAAYRFGCWVGDQQEHYDVQRVSGDSVSPPNVFCSKRNLWAEASRSYVNIFLNDSVRDAEIFEGQKKTG